MRNQSTIEQLLLHTEYLQSSLDLSLVKQTQSTSIFAKHLTQYLKTSCFGSCWPLALLETCGVSSELTSPIVTNVSSSMAMHLNGYACLLKCLKAAFLDLYYSSSISMISLRYHFPLKFCYMLMTPSIAEKPYHLMIEVFSRKILI